MNIVKRALKIAPKTKIVVFVLGFYDRRNAGDELYKSAIPRCFEGIDARFDFACVDDVSRIPEGVDVVIFGGGDIINAYFMKKAESLLADYGGPAYAFSVGIPYASESRYLRFFDHVFARSRGDYEIAREAVGSLNVTYLPDASFSMMPRKLQGCARGPCFRLGVCLAQPAFAGNARSESLFDSIARGIVAAKRRARTMKIVLLSFNTSNKNPTEGDAFANDRLSKRLKEIDPEIDVEVEDSLDATQLFDRVGSLDATLCMRYHSLLFSVLQGKIAIAVYCSPKVAKFVEDNRKHVIDDHKLETDSMGRPTRVSQDRIESAIVLAMRSQAPDPPPRVDWRAAKETIFERRKRSRILCRRPSETFETAIDRCRKTLSRYLRVDAITVENMLESRGPIRLESSAVDFARVACYCVTGSLQTPCVWGFAENLVKQNFCLKDALRYVWEYGRDDAPGDEAYHPGVSCPIFSLANVDASSAADFKSYHRSGWAYAVGGLMNIDAGSRGKAANLTIDTYVDRTFHWGLDALKASGALPYRTDWIGFVHHTFDKTHSVYNCVELFKRVEFLRSLETCRGLVALSEYLADDLRVALVSTGFSRVPVYVVYHPMEDTPVKFDFRKFTANSNRRVIQIGAWLRNAYAIYDLKLWKNRLCLRKTALKGKEMDQHFKPPGFIDKARRVFASEDGERCACVSGNVVACANGVNKYCEGLQNAIERNDRSVEILEKLSNDEYDNLLSENLVFLNLVDCSAVNTVLECLFRNTPIVVNRHPAIEEILGDDYPCFYEDSIDATLMLNDLRTIEAAHEHLKRLDKSRYSIDHFVFEVQKIVARAKNRAADFERPSKI